MRNVLEILSYCHNERFYTWWNTLPAFVRVKFLQKSVYVIIAGLYSYGNDGKCEYDFDCNRIHTKVYATSAHQIRLDSLRDQLKLHFNVSV
jgi:hypothetical protein